MAIFIEPFGTREQKITAILMYRHGGGPQLARMNAGLSAVENLRANALVAYETAKAALEQLPDEELNAQFNEVMGEAARRQQEKADRDEAARFYNWPTARADFNYWAKYACWSIEEAVALVLGREPKVVNRGSLEPFAKISNFVVIFDRLMDLAMRAVATHQLTDGIEPGAFIAWAKRYDIEVPAELESAVTRYAGFIGDWKTLFEGVNEQLKVARAGELDANREGNVLRAQVDLLTGHLNLAEARLAQANPAADAKPAKGADPREIDSLRRIAIGMAIRGYGYDPTEAKSTKIGEIVDDLEHVGVGLEADTVRRHLKKAAELVPRDNSKDAHK